MQLVEQHIIDRHDARFAAIDPACFASKNLYNATLFIIRQAFFAHEHVPTYAQLAHRLKNSSEFCALPAKVAQWTARQVCGDWNNFWKAQAAYQQYPAKFTLSSQAPPLQTQTGWTCPAGLHSPGDQWSRSGKRPDLSIPIGHHRSDQTQGAAAGSDRSAGFSLCRRSHLYRQTKLPHCRSAQPEMGCQSRPGH